MPGLRLLAHGRGAATGDPGDHDGRWPARPASQARSRASTRGSRAACRRPAFPPQSALASSFDPGLVRRIGEALGAEARAQGVQVVLGPGINIKRSPLCGRNFEYFSEDPLVSGVLAAALVQGLQAQGVGASVKHFAANNQETDRARVSADVDERTLREIYLPAFERVVTEASPWTVMCSYNKVNGTYASQNSWLLTEVLRDEWGFDGLVVSDWGAVHDRVAALAAGLDLEMPPEARRRRRGDRGRRACGRAGRGRPRPGRALACCSSSSAPRRAAARRRRPSTSTPTTPRAGRRRRSARCC